MLDHIEHEEIAFQFGDGLMCITHPDGDYVGDDLAQSMAKDIEEMRKYIADGRSIIVVHKEDVVSEKRISYLVHDNSLIMINFASDI